MDTIIRIKLDKAIKEEAEDMGLNLTVLINDYFKQLVAARKEVPYVPEQMTPKLEKSLRRVKKEMDESKDRKAFTNAGDFSADLKK